NVLHLAPFKAGRAGRNHGHTHLPRCPVDHHCSRRRPFAKAEPAILRDATRQRFSLAGAPPAPYSRRIALPLPGRRGPTIMATDQAWTAAQRLEGWAGEVRVNLIRIVALVAFYGYHLLNVYALSDDPSLRGDFHLTVTIVVAAWAVAALLLHVLL